jgi:RHS repeat-associated protein
MKMLVRSALCTFVLALASIPCAAQDVATGTPQFASLSGSPDTINLGNLNAHWDIPILSRPGRGLNFTYDLTYDSSVWYPVISGSSKIWQPVTNFGWNGVTAAGIQSINYMMSYSSGTCGQYGTGSYQVWQFGGVTYTDQLNIVHTFSSAGGSYINSTGGIACPPSGANPPGLMTAGSGDNSGLTAYFQLYAGYMTIYLTTANGAVLTPPVTVNSGSAPNGTYLTTDSNGNEMTNIVNSGNLSITDTLGTSVLQLAEQGASTVNISYTSPANTPATYAVTYKPYNIHTYFQCSGITEYTAQNVYLVDRVTLPDQTYYQFHYEQTYDPNYPSYYSGRVTSVTLPTGGSVSYTYTGGNQNNGIECLDGSAAGMTRTLNPGGSWTYARTLVSGTQPHGSKWTTTVIDPSNNQTVANFAEDSGTTYNLYPTQQQVYQGSTTLLLTTVTCYNASFSGCATAGVSSPISQTDTYTILPTNQTRLSELAYSGSLVTTDNEFDYGVTQGASPGTAHLVRQTNTTYNSVGKPTYTDVNDFTHTPSVTLSATTYSYDQGSVVAASGTPQHTSVTGPRGNLTTIQQQVNGTTNLYQTFSYYDTGTLYQSTGLSTSASSPGPTTTYVYGTNSCGNSFPTQVNEPLNLSKSTVWNCAGGVATQMTDENGNTTKTDYTDPYFWRPADSYDEESNETLYGYTGQTTSSSTMTFNSAHSVDGAYTTVDGFGRLILNQRPQGPGATSYDTTETDFNSTGQPYRFTMPFSASLGGTSSSAPGTTVVYDALNRPTAVTAGDGGTTTYQYIGNDVLQKVSGSQTFQKQLEYDGLSRLTSVCEISSSLPLVASCNQQNPVTGYWTKYSYDALGRLLSVTQNAQAASGSQQARVYAYDMIGRMTSESNPETSNSGSNGTTTYTYDSACTTTPASPGDMTRRVDNAGNNTCYAYDALHRPTAQGWNTVCRFFNYDTSVTPPAGIAVLNTKTRMLEAFTTNCGSTSYTDEWFSYSPRGELTDVYELTHAGGSYFHTSATYWANRSLQSLSGIPSVPSLYFGASNGAGLDSEGRATQVTASLGQNPVASVTYWNSNTPNYLGALTGVTYGSLDSDSFTFDSNTGRPLSYTYNVNGNADSGTMVWNTNGTLSNLTISDTIPGTSDSQNCTYTYDDLGRIGGQNANGWTVDCGSGHWQQSFSYDAFGNVSKNSNGGGGSFAPTYNSATNHFTLNGFNVQYDGDGNLLADNLNSYTWDPNWDNMTSVNGASATYDAMGRVVRQQSGSSYLDVVYSPIGKTAIMNGSTLTKAFVPLPGGGTVIYNSSGLAYYRHADWLGSSRLTSTPGRALYSSSSYAPFGEQYAVSGQPDPSFTGQNSDTVPSLYDFLARRQSPSQGRWISPDPAGFTAVDPTNPQSWNRYAYVSNQPMNTVDPFGLWSQNGGDCGLWCGDPFGGDCPECGDGSYGGGTGYTTGDTPGTNGGGGDGGPSITEGDPPSEPSPFSCSSTGHVIFHPDECSFLCVPSDGSFGLGWVHASMSRIRASKAPGCAALSKCPAAMDIEGQFTDYTIKRCYATKQ